MDIDMYEDIFTSLFWFPASVLLLACLGIMWAPAAALICALIARMKNLDVPSYALAGAWTSALCIFPWIYLSVRMFLNRPPPTPVVVPVYVLTYGLWVAINIGFFNVAALVAAFSDDWLNEDPYGIIVLLIVALFVMLPINVFTLGCSAWRLMQRYRTTRGELNDRGSGMLAFDYVAPFVGLIGSSFGALLAAVIWGLSPLTNM